MRWTWIGANGTFVSGDANVSMSGPVNGVFTVTGKHLYTDEDGLHRDPSRSASPTRPRRPMRWFPLFSVPLTLTDPPANATAATGPFLATERDHVGGAVAGHVYRSSRSGNPVGLLRGRGLGNGSFVSGDANVSTSGLRPECVTVTGQHLYNR